MNKTTAGAMVIAALLGGLVGYWYRGQVLLNQKEARAMAIAPQVLRLAPPGSVPPPPQ